MRFWTIFFRSCRLRCPACGKGRLFRRWFAMFAACEKCHTDFRREPGFYLGSIYLNYGLTTLVVMIAYPLLLFSRTLSNDLLMWLSLIFMVVFPVCFFRHARSLWLGFDEFWDPQKDRQK